MFTVTWILKYRKLDFFLQLYLLWFVIDMIQNHKQRLQEFFFRFASSYYPTKHTILNNDIISWSYKHKYLYSFNFSESPVPPPVSLLQNTPSSPVSCHAAGFYPNRVMMFWRKDGEEINDGVKKGEIIPNHDWTFHTSVDLNV